MYIPPPFPFIPFLFPSPVSLVSVLFTTSFRLFWSLSSTVFPFSLHFPVWHPSAMASSSPYRLSRLSIALVRILLPSREKAWISLSLLLLHIAFARFSFLPTCQTSPRRSSSIGWAARRARLSQSFAQSDTVVTWHYARQSLQLVQISHHHRRIVTTLVYIFPFPFQMMFARSSIVRFPFGENRTSIPWIPWNAHTTQWTLKRNLWRHQIPRAQGTRGRKGERKRRAFCYFRDAAKSCQSVPSWPSRIIAGRSR